MPFRKLVGSYKDYNLSTHILEDGYLAVDVNTGSLRLGDGSTAGGIAISTGGGGGSSTSLGDLTAIGSTLSAPSNADLTLVSSNGNVVIEGIRIAGTTIQTEDSTPGIQIAGNLIPSQDGVFQLGSETRRWQTAYLAAETIDLGGATIKSDGSGELTIAATGATLPTGSKVGTNGISLTGSKAGTLARPVQNVKLFVSDGSTTFTDAQLLAQDGDLTLEFNATVEDVPVYTDAQQTFTLADGTALSENAAGITLFQF